MSESDTVLSALADGVLTLTLNRPDKLNAFNDEMHLALRAGFERAHADENVRAVLLTGAGRGFSAGQDLGDRDPKKGVPDLGQTIETFYNPLLRLIRSLEKPVICAVNGVAAGAGANIAFACDITLAARSARFIQAFAKIGLVPDSGGTWSLPRLIGEARATELILTGRTVDADEAERIGLVDRRVPAGADRKTALELATTIAGNSPVGVRNAKRALRRGSDVDLATGLDVEDGAWRATAFSGDRAEGVAAFNEKRRPDWPGR